MKDLLSVFECLLLDASNKCSTEVQVKDLRVCTARFHNEGLSFLTITLPNFLEDFMSCLEEGKVSSSHFVGWSKRQCLPAFLQGFTRLVFEPKTGIIRNEPSIQAIHSIRQLCSFAKKIRINCTESRTQSAFDSYCQIENSLRHAPKRVSTNDMLLFISTSRILWSMVFGKDNLDYFNLVPFHGPGSTAEGCSGNRKFLPTEHTWPIRLNRMFSYEYCNYNTEESYFHSIDPQVPELEPRAERPVKIITVPKTLKTPRIIAMEPIAMQMVQQSIKDYVVKSLETNSITAGQINFSDQSVNRLLALSSSKNQRYATLDMSAASDRIHKYFIWKMLSINPKLRDACFISRSRKASLRGSVFRLRKFASMGSALCFPLEAMYFYTLCIASILKHRDLPITSPNIRSIGKEVYVYGDDIIIPVDEVESTITFLENFSNKVSKTKSFYKGKFRESCGMDAYDGVDITPIYMRSLLPSRQCDASSVISIVETANQLSERGFICTANFFREKIDSLVGNLPTNNKDTEGLAWWSSVFQPKEVKTRFNKRLQRLEVRTLVPKIRRKKDEISGYQALFKCLYLLHCKSKDLNRRSWHSHWDVLNAKLSQSADHLKFTSRRGALTLKRRWVLAQ